MTVMTVTESKWSEGLGGEGMSFQDRDLKVAVMAEGPWKAGEHAHERFAGTPAWGIRVIVGKR